MPQLLPVPNSAYQLVAILGGLAVLRTIFIAIRSQYRLRFHPLAKFPGPKEACISDDWEYGLCKQPQAFPERIYEELHEKYNTRALRIRPNELHISDPKLYSVIYNQTTNFYKYPPFYEGFNTPHTLFAETDPVLHRERRKLLNPMFSRTGVFKLEPIIHEKYAVLEQKIRRLCKNQNIDIFMALRCMTMDVISEFAFARSTGKINECPDGFKCELLESLDVAASILTHSQHNAFLRFIISISPPFIVRKMNKDVGRVLDFLDFARSSVEHWRQHSDKVSHPVVFDRLKTLTTEYQATEAVDILVAGTDTTAFTLTRGIAMITGNPEIQNKLVNALREGLSSEPSGKPIELLKLEKIDYLIGCVKESLRFALPVPGRLPRVVPGGNAPAFIVDGQVVPPGTTVGISAYTVHFSKEIWGPDAREFRPERWMGPDSKSLEQYLVTFSKGSRMCIGQNVAHAEMTIILANLFYNFKISRPYDWKDPVATDAFNSALFNQTVDLVFEPITNGI